MSKRAIDCLINVHFGDEAQPEWMQRVADFNPVNWAVEAGRVAADGNGDWAFVAVRAGLLAAFLLLALLAATSAFRAYQRAA